MGSSLSKYGACRLSSTEQLYLQGNQLTGSVSTDMAALVNLVRLNFNTNPDLGGNFAEAFGGLIALGELYRCDFLDSFCRPVSNRSFAVGLSKQIDWRLLKRLSRE